MRAADVTHLDASTLTGFNVGYRCKSLSVCAPAHNCIYYGENLGSLQSTELTFNDGLELQQPEAIRVRIDTGAASQCGNPSITLATGAKLLIAHDGQQHTVYFPPVTAQSLALYVREDGATFYDAALTSIAQRAP
jgi:hypothetical protein